MRLLLAVLILMLVTPARGARLEYVGLHSYTSKQLKEAFAGRLDYIRKREATTFRADDAAFLVENFLHSHGLPDATVAWELSENNTIILTVDEGISKFLGPITVQGIEDVEEVKEIQEQFRAPFPEANKKRAFSAEAIPLGLERVINLLHSKGYWKASLTHLQGDLGTNGDVPFALQITPGNLLTIAPPILNTPVPPNEKLQQHLLDVVGVKASSKHILGIRKTITENYRRSGFTDIALTIEKESNDTQLLLKLTVDPGKKFTVRAIKTDGLNKTLPNRVRNRFANMVGEHYDEDQVNEEVKKLLATGAFERVQLESTKLDNAQLDLTLHLTETKARGYSLAFGFGSIDGYVFGARYHDRNLWGRLWNLSAGIEVTSLGVLGEITRTDPSFLERDLSLNNRLFLITRDYDSYRKYQGGISNELSWKLGDHYSATIGLENSINDISTTLPDGLIGPENYLHHRLYLRQTYDRRNDPTLPSDGFLARLDSASGFVHGDTSTSYFESEAQLSYYRSLGDNTSYALSIRGGFILPSDGESDLPIDLRKFLGGSNSVRSFPERDLGPEVNGRPTGGTSWWVANAEYSHTLNGPFRWLVFIDAGALDGEVELAAGLGLRIDLPVGPIRLEYGHSLSQDPGEPSGAFHFAIGSTF